MKMTSEKILQESWDKNRVFQSNPDEREKFFITVPWPYTSGPLHVGHGRTFAIADIIARYKRLRGYNVLFPMGFHESGTPIGAISDKIRKGERKTLELYRNYISAYEEKSNVNKILESFVDPHKVASYFADKIQEDFTRMGLSIDWRRSFRSTDLSYKRMVEWQFRLLDSQGKIKRGRHSVLFSPDDGNPVGEDDIDDGDTNKVSIEDFVSVLFKGEKFSLAASSLRPETVFGITNLWINEEAEYVFVDFDGEKIAMSEKAAGKIKLQQPGMIVVGKCSAKDILAGEYTVPVTGKKIHAYANEHIDPDQASGIVFSVPGHSVRDLQYERIFGLNLDPIYLINVDGRLSKADDALKKHSDVEIANSELYKEEFYSGYMLEHLPLIGGMKVSEAREKIKNMLIEEKNAFLFHETSRKAKTRNGSPVHVAVFDNQWFIDYLDPEWKIATKDAVNSMRFTPDFYRKNMLDIVDWISVRACARKRGLGTPLPMDPSWVIESLSDSTIYPAFYTISHIIGDRELSDDEFNYIFLQDRAKDGVYPEYVESAKKEFSYWYGVDERITAQPHLSNHLIFYLMNHTAIFGKKYWPKGITIAGTVISQGAKISKSKGNAVSLLDIVNTQGADLFRLYVAVNSDPWSTLDWNQKDVEIISKKYEELKELIRNSLNNVEKPSGIHYSIFASRFRMHLRNFSSEMERYSIRNAYIEIIYEIINDLADLRNMGGVPEIAVSSVLDSWIPALSCVMPHFCEEIWKKIGKKGFVSNYEMNNFEAMHEDEKIVSSLKYVKNIISDVREIRKVTGITPDGIEVIICGESERADVKKILHNNFNVSDKKLIAMVMKSRGKIDLEVDEKYAMESMAELIETSLGMPLEWREHDRIGDRKTPLPGKPVINLTGGVKNADR